MVGSGAALSACAKAVPGTPRAARSGPARPTSSRRPAPRRIRLGTQKGQPHAVEVVRAVVDELGIDQVEVLELEFGALFPALQAKRVDLAGILYPGQVSCGSLVWSAPDHVGLCALAVPVGNPKGFKTIADAVGAGAKIAVMKDLPEHKFVIRTKVPAGQVLAIPGPVEMLKAVERGEAACAAFSDIGLRSLAKADLAEVEVTAPFTLEGEPPVAGAYAFGSDVDKELVAGFDKELRSLQSSGRWLKLAEPSGFIKENLPPADLRTEDLCAR
ncbi:MAG TPA: transporter substrate-binding domain-containing protein [Actinophytocola sp.]|uniref:transporter substrate-binding domain-containing protein n=1 Tax=Actinophytocola sp. TaxID=1872138 RepID=UPI002DBA175A|nr:transporter substrate-binding domain-containing protein [Actinophytocola sp.]HEU5470038.1 transporter substrate-binding domain-containing protein [Actinophytocola sp.]